MEIRVFEKEDAAKLEALEKIWHKEGVSPYMSMNTKSDFLKHDRKGDFIFIAEHNKEIIGYVLVKRKRSKMAVERYNLKRFEKYLELDSLFVLKKHRRKKAGGLLLKKVLDTAKKEGYDHIFLAADSVEMSRLVEFYKKFGFKQIYTQMYSKF